MEKGDICIGVDPKLTTDPNNPWRTGRWAVLREEAFDKMGMIPELRDRVLAARICFLETEVWDKLGIPVGETPEAPEEIHNADAKKED